MEQRLCKLVKSATYVIYLFTKGRTIIRSNKIDMNQCHKCEALMRAVFLQTSQLLFFHTIQNAVDVRRWQPISTVSFIIFVQGILCTNCSKFCIFSNCVNEFYFLFVIINNESVKFLYGNLHHFYQFSILHRTFFPDYCID